jgi:hypothetical protein
MEDELFALLYRLLVEEGNRRPRPKGVQFNDALILAVAAWAVLHDRPTKWACKRRHWSPRWREHWLRLPSRGTMSQRLRSCSVQLLLEQVFYRVAWSVVAPLVALGAWSSAFCLCRRVDSKPLPVGGFSKDRDARWGYASGGAHYRGYKLDCCWGKSPTAPEAMVLGPMNLSDQAGSIELVERVQRLHDGNARGYLLADATNDTNPLHQYAGQRGLQPITPRKLPGAGLGYRAHSAYRLRSIELLEGHPDPMCFALHQARSGSNFGPALYRQRGQIERDYGNLCAFGGGLQCLPSWVRRPHRVATWVIVKLIINALRICRNQRLRL